MLKVDNCFYCEDGEKRKSLMIEICKFEKSTLYLNRDQKHLGRVVLKYHEHKTDPSQLTDEENAIFFSEMREVSKAIRLTMVSMVTEYLTYTYTLFQNIKMAYNGADLLMIPLKRSF